MMWLWGKFVSFVSFEWIVTKLERPNGGDVILLRALLIALLAYFGALGIKNILDPERIFSFDASELKKQVSQTLQWFGALFGSVYAALYARFASQWRYLANLYNRIKETEAKSGDAVAKDIIASWKAGFMEDAEDLHLATKRLFVSVMYAWGNDEGVKEKFIENTPGRRVRFNKLMTKVNNAFSSYDKQLSERGDANGEQCQ